MRKKEQRNSRTDLFIILRIVVTGKIWAESRPFSCFFYQELELKPESYLDDLWLLLNKKGFKKSFFTLPQKFMEN